MRCYGTIDDGVFDGGRPRRLAATKSSWLNTARITFVIASVAAVIITLTSFAVKQERILLADCSSVSVPKQELKTDIQPQNDLKWHIHYASDVDDRARCLDGTPGAFYTSLAPPNSPNADKWILSFMWGGWCSLDVPIDWRDDHTVDHCYHRSFKSTGTTLGRRSADNVGEKYYQIRDLEANPTFHDWNYVFIPYCDGTSFAARRDDSLILDGPRGKRRIFLRGAYIREAVAQMLLPMGLSKARVVVVSGASAGGLAAHMQADWWAEEVVPWAKVLGLVDYGYFPRYTFDNSSNVEVAPFKYESKVTEYPIQSYVDQMRLLHQRSHAVLHTRCAQALGTTEAWRCMLGRDLAPFVRTPTFLLGSLYDSWQLENLLGYTADAARVHAHGRRIYEDHMAFLLSSRPVGHGAFVHSCSAHMGQWFLDIDGTDMRSAVDKWVRWHLSPASASPHGGHRRGQRPDNGDDDLPLFLFSDGAAGESGKDVWPPGGSGGYLLWLQKRKYPCPQCCERTAPASRRRGSVAALDGAGDAAMGAAAGGSLSAM